MPPISNCANWVRCGALGTMPIAAGRILDRFFHKPGCMIRSPGPRAITVHLRRNNANFGTFTRRPMHNWRRRQLPRQRYVHAFNTSLKSYFAETAAARLDVMVMPAQLGACGVYATQATNRMNGRQDSVSWLFYCRFFSQRIAFVK